jgi:glyceraldehyde 3-phosphate dehydrogenase
MNIEAINTSSTTPEQLAYTLQYDSVYRAFDKKVETQSDGITIESKKIKAYNFRDPSEIPWDDHNIDVVIDCTGVFKDRESLSKHIRGSVKKVILCVPTSDASIKHIVLGVNEDTFDFAGTDIMSNASCTTNCAAVMAHVLNKEFGIESGFMTTVHSYTSSQALVDNKADKPTRGRAAALSIIPTTTGASDAVCLVTAVPEEQLGAAALRVPTPVGSITDMVCLVKKDTTVEEIHNAFKSYAEGSLKGILDYTDVPLVSADYIGNPYSCTYDANYTSVVKGRHVKIFGWYDNEWGYSNRVVDLVARIAEIV